jgi:hypothetical protein
MPGKRKKSSAGFLIVALICAGAVFAVAQYVKAGHQFISKPEPEVTVEAPTPTRVHHHVRSSKEKGNADQEPGPFELTPKMEGGKITFARSPVQVPDDEDARVYVVNRFLENARLTEPGARLISVKITDGVANLHFTPEMDRTFGTDDESTLLNGILTSLGQFSELKSAMFYAGDKRIDTFGNVDLTVPQPVLRDEL